MPQTGEPVIGVDLMGGDKAPGCNIDGCLLALKRGVNLVVYGSRDAVDALASKGRFPNLRLEPCRETIAFDDAPLQAIRSKPDSTVRRGIEDVKAGATGAFVSAGSTGALVAGGVVLLGRAKGVDKPCLATILPSMNPRGVLTLDLGASADARPQTLVQFAIMGDAYARNVLGWNDPSVCLLNIGMEPEKGNMSARKAHSLLQKAPVNFRGNIEARDVFLGKADIVVTDGFTGNIFIKACEGTAMFQMDSIRREVSSGIVRRMAALALKSAFRRVKATLDYSAYGGAPLLGLGGCVVKCHGSSGAEAIANGIGQARIFLVNDVARIIAAALSESPSEGE